MRARAITQTARNVLVVALLIVVPMILGVLIVGPGTPSGRNTRSATRVGHKVLAVLFEELGYRVHRFERGMEVPPPAPAVVIALEPGPALLRQDGRFAGGLIELVRAGSSALISLGPDTDRSAEIDDRDQLLGETARRALEAARGVEARAKERARAADLAEAAERDRDKGEGGRAASDRTAEKIDRPIFDTGALDPADAWDIERLARFVNLELREGRLMNAKKNTPLALSGPFAADLVAREGEGKRESEGKREGKREGEGEGKRESEGNREGEGEGKREREAEGTTQRPLEPEGATGAPVLEITRPRTFKLFGAHDAKVLLAAEGEPLLLELTLGKGRLLLLSEPRLLQNGALGRPNHARLAVRIAEHLAAAANTDTIYFEEFSHGGREAANIFELAATTSAKWPLLQILLITACWIALVAGRRRSVVPFEVPPRRSRHEVIDAMASLFLRSGDTAGAGERLYQLSRLRIARALGAADKASAPSELSAGVALRTGKNADEVRACLEGPPVVNHRMLVALAERLRRLRTELDVDR